MAFRVLRSHRNLLWIGGSSACAGHPARDFTQAMSRAVGRVIRGRPQSAHRRDEDHRPAPVVHHDAAEELREQEGVTQ